jgi:predicted regulator of Ras-like GTPase activity (Roadblock/LC7/MglB family)
MSNVKEIIEQIVSTIDGAMVAALVDADSGMILGSAGSGLDIELAAAGNCDVVRAKLKIMKSLNLNDTIEDMLITLGKQYHILRPTEKYEAMFIYVVLEKSKANLGLARRQVLVLERQLVI